MMNVSTKNKFCFNCCENHSNLTVNVLKPEHFSVLQPPSVAQFETRTILDKLGRPGWFIFAAARQLMELTQNKLQYPCVLYRRDTLSSQ